MPSSNSESSRDAFDAVGRGLQHHSLRRANVRAVLTVIGFNAGLSNAEISRLSGLAPQTVSAILSDLDQAGMISRGEVLRGRRGQPATPISLHPEGAFAIGVELGRRHADVVLLNMDAEVLQRSQMQYPYPDARTLFDELGSIIGRMLVGFTAEQRSRLRDIGVAMPSNLAAHIAQVQTTQAPRAHWDDVDVVAELSGRTGLDVRVFNDGNAACWAELIAFPRPRPANFIYFLISRNVGAGIVGEGMLWEGPSGNSANLGAMLVADCNGKLQPAHSIASVAALWRRLNAAGIETDIARVEDWDWSSFGVVLDQWLTETAQALAQIVFNTTMVIGSELVVVDSIVPDTIIAELVTRLSNELHALAAPTYIRPQVLAGHLGGVAPAVGAGELTLYRRYFSRSLADLAS
ncbi:ROK family transcriptional regulator [Devosia sp. 2618]|uniref:ROK family transcriptional regulator n=1 Tax=Devosia sp. 2618 TaxID=3156454 RepID=UPI00339961E0